MPELTHRQWMQLQETLLGLHEHRELATFPAFIIRQLQLIFDCDTVSLCDDRGGLREVPWLRSDAAWNPHATTGFPSSEGSRGYMMCSAFDPDFHHLREEFLACFPARPPAAKIQDLHAGKISRLLDSTTQHEFRQSQLYADVYRPMGINHEISVFIPLEGGDRLTVAVSRERVNFSNWEVLQLGILQAHVRTAYNRLVALLDVVPHSGMPTPRVAEVLTQKWRLTPRELEVLYWVAEGKLNAEIATILGSRRNTVRKHVEHILQKLHVENRQTAALLYRESWQKIGPQ